MAYYYEIGITGWPINTGISAVLEKSKRDVFPKRITHNIRRYETDGPLEQKIIDELRNLPNVTYVL